MDIAARLEHAARRPAGTIDISLFLQLQSHYEARLEMLFQQLGRLRSAVRELTEREVRLQKECAQRITDERGVCEARLHVKEIQHALELDPLQCRTQRDAVALETMRQELQEADRIASQRMPRVPPKDTDEEDGDGAAALRRVITAEECPREVPSQSLAAQAEPPNSEPAQTPPRARALANIADWSLDDLSKPIPPGPASDPGASSMSSDVMPPHPEQLVDDRAVLAARADGIRPDRTGAGRARREANKTRTDKNGSARARREAYGNGVVAGLAPSHPSTPGTPGSERGEPRMRIQPARDPEGGCGMSRGGGSERGGGEGVSSSRSAPANPPRTSTGCWPRAEDRPQGGSSACSSGEESSGVATLEVLRRTARSLTELRALHAGNG